MALVTLNEAKAYLRVDSADEDVLIDSLLASAEKYCADVGRQTDEDWAVVVADPQEDDSPALMGKRAILKMATLYALGYLYEHRENADHHDLAMTLRNLLFAIREGVP